MDVDLRTVIERDLDLVVALLVADFGLGDMAAAGVFEGGGTGLLERLAADRCFVVVAATSGDGDAGTDTEGDRATAACRR